LFVLEPLRLANTLDLDGDRVDRLLDALETGVGRI
jgi:hypothetical protein